MLIYANDADASAQARFAPRVARRDAAYDDRYVWRCHTRYALMPDADATLIADCRFTLMLRSRFFAIFASALFHDFLYDAAITRFADIFA